ncbi:MAG: TspO/MBR family protein [Candidatus Nitrosocosmicus sp.]
MFKNIFKFVISIIICESAGIIGSIFTLSSVINWFPTLVKPWFSPPSWIFGPVWTILYFLMGLSLYLIWNFKAELSQQKYKKQFYILFGIQLIINALWSFFFFGLKSPAYGLLDILFLDITVAMTIAYACRISKYPAILLAPYITWITFATILNFEIALLNK